MFGLAFADDSTLYTTGDGGLYRWNLKTGAHELLAPATKSYHTWTRFSGDARIALSAEGRFGQGSDCPKAVLHDLGAGTSRELTAFGACSTWSGFSIAIDPTVTVAATGNLNGVVRVGRLSSRETHVLLGHKGAVDSIAISPDLRWVATTGEDNALRLWPMPDLSKPPLHTLPKAELVAKLHSLTNLRVVRDRSSSDEWKVEVGPFPGWKKLPEM